MGLRLPGVLLHDLALGRGVLVPEGADVPVERLVGQREFEVDAGIPDRLVPPVDAALAVGDVVVAEPLVDGQKGGVLADGDLAVLDDRHVVDRVRQHMIVVDLGFQIAPLEAHGIVVGPVGGMLLPEQIEADGEVEVHVLLDGRQVDAAVGADIEGVVLGRHLRGALDHPADAGLADEHVVGFLGQHELARPGQRIEAAFGQAVELELAVPVLEVGEHEEAEPVVGVLVERLQDAGLVGIAGVTLQHLFRFLAAVAAEVGVKQIDHGPQMAALLDVHLIKRTQVIKGRADHAQAALLLHRGRLGVALGDDQAAQFGAVFAGHVLPGGLALVAAEVDLAAFFLVGEKNAPAVLGHPHVVELGPAGAGNVDGGAQVDVVGRALHGAEFVPPVEELRLPLLQRPLQAAVVGKPDVVGNFLVQIDICHGSIPVPC